MIGVWLVMLAVALAAGCVLDRKPSRHYRDDRFDGFRAFVIRASRPELQIRLGNSSPAAFVRRGSRWS